MAPIDEAEARRRLLMLGEVFTPSAPISDQELFAGRNHELFSVIEAMQSAGQHAVIYGERGVGKTSLARIAMQIAAEQSGILAVRVNCDGSDTYESLWQKVLDEMQIRASESPPSDRTWLEAAVAECGPLFSSPDLSPSTIRLGLRKFSQHKPIALFFDEFLSLIHI